MIKIREELIHYIWQHQLFSNPDLRTRSGESVRVITPGIRNPNAGPDFGNSKVVIGDQIWYGPIEIHVHTGDWLKHKHQNDPLYAPVILHVVYEDKGAGPEGIPLLELKDHVSQAWLEKYEQLAKSELPIPCSGQLKTVPEVIRVSALNRAIIDRIRKKSDFWLAQLESESGDWNRVLCKALCRAMGSSVNKDAFFELAEIIPAKLLIKYSYDLTKLQALLFGSAGFLAKEPVHEYGKELSRQFSFITHKYSLSTMAVERWKRLRLRPNNFPDLRIAQLSAILHAFPSLFSVILDCNSKDEISCALQKEAVGYWLRHYSLNGKEGRPIRKRLGREAIDGIIINAIAPVFFAYGIYRGLDGLKQKALELVGSCQSENNKVIRQWAQIGWQASDALESQALLEQYNVRCTEQKCLQCQIGSYILRPQKA